MIETVTDLFYSACISNSQFAVNVFFNLETEPQFKLKIIQWALVYPTMFVPYEMCWINQVLDK